MYFLSFVPLTVIDILDIVDVGRLMERLALSQSPQPRLHTRSTSGRIILIGLDLIR